jgi:hypothetical protein
MGAPNQSTAVVVESAANDDPYDLSKLRLDQNFVEMASVKKLLTTVPVRKPLAQDFVRVHPDAAFRMPCAIIELKDDREHYLVTADIVAAVATEVVMKTVYTTINRQGVVFLWPVPLPTPDGRVNEWHRSAQEAAERAIGRWIRMKANMPLGAYEIFEAPDSTPDPVWPEHSFKGLLEIGFRDRLIRSLDHPVLKRLRGEC